MKLRLWIVVSAATAAVFMVGFCFADASPSEEQALVRIIVGNEADLAHVQSSGLPVFAHLRCEDGLALLAGARPGQIDALREQRLEATLLDPNIHGKHYYVAYPMPARPHPAWSDYGELLYEDSIQALLEMSPDAAERLAEAGVELRAIKLDPKPLRSLTLRSALPTSIEPDSLIQLIIDEVDSTKVYSYTGDLSGEWPAEIGGQPYTILTRHTFSGEPIKKATEYVGEHLEDLGLNVEYHEWGDSTYPNVIGELPGQVSPDSIVIICAHLDDMPSGPVAPGADDNASGSVAVLIAADILTQYQWNYTLRFAFWTGEEQGLWGSDYYAQRSYNWGEKIVGVLNLDMIAYNTAGSNPGIDLHAESSIPPTLDLAQLFADVVDAYSLDLTPEIIPDGIGSSDHASFQDYGYTAILGIEDLGDFNPRYHTTDDRLQYLDIGYFTEFVRASIGTFAHMGGVYTDVSGVEYPDEYAADDSQSSAVAVLHPGRPNPVRLETIIRYDIARACGVELRVYDAQGRLTSTLYEGHHSPGHYEVAWNGESRQGEQAPPGVYFCYLETSTGFREAYKLVLLR